MRIVQITDTHIAADGPGASARADDLARVIDDINRLRPLPDAVIHTGDIAHRGRAGDYARAAKLLAQLEAPLHTVAGNRDDRGRLAVALGGTIGALTAPPYLQYAVEGHRVRLVALDTKSADSNRGTICDDRFALLDRLLGSEKKRPAVVFMHHPPFDVPGSKYPFQFETRATVKRLDGMLRGHRQVVAVLCGHAHRASEDSIGGRRVLTAPSVAVDLRRGESASAHRRAPCYLLHDIDAAGAVSTTRRTVTADHTLRRAG